MALQENCVAFVLAAACQPLVLGICGYEIGYQAQNLALAFTRAKPLTNLHISIFAEIRALILRIMRGEYLDNLRMMAHNLRKRCGQ